MAYVTASPGLGCAANCGCATCAGRSWLGERYLRDEEEADANDRALSPPAASDVGYFRFGEIYPTQPAPLLGVVGEPAQRLPGPPPARVQLNPTAGRRYREHFAPREVDRIRADTIMRDEARLFARLHASIDFLAGAYAGREPYHIPLRERLFLERENASRDENGNRNGLAERDPASGEWRSRVTDLPAFQSRLSQPEFATRFAQLVRAEREAARTQAVAGEVVDIVQLLLSLAASVRGLPTRPSRSLPSLTDAELANRARSLHRQLAAQELSEAGLEVTEARLRQSLGRATVSIVEIVKNGQTIRIINTNRSSFYRILSHNPGYRQPGEILGSRNINVYETGTRARQSIHPEQIGLNDARGMGVNRGRVASSNPGCEDLCLSSIREQFPGFRHVNPSHQQRHQPH